jgi:predicted DNA-binding transcriptional regulator YafY
MPPLLLDDDEAVAVAVGLGAVATWQVGVAETSLTALAKLEQVMPAPLRQRVVAIREATSVVPGTEPPLDLSGVGVVAAATRRHERLRFGYTKPGGTPEKRHAEPQRLVSWGPLWYLFAWDLDRDDWRVFRVDRMVPGPPTGVRFRPRRIPEDDLVRHVVRRIIRAGWRYRAHVLVHAPAATVAAKIVIPVDIEEVDASTCRVELGADDPDALALWLTQLGADIEVIEGEELALAFDRLVARFQRAVGTKSNYRSPAAGSGT